MPTKPSFGFVIAGKALTWLGCLFNHLCFIAFNLNKP